MLTGRFEEQVKKNPQKIAVRTKDGEMTYDQLNNLANGVAKRILEKCDTSYKLTEKEMDRYKRQLLIHDWGVEGQEKLKHTTVFVAGAGGSGSPLLMQLALCGIGTIIICDFDQVELSNLNRQCLHDESRIGINKAVSAKMSLNKLNPEVNVIVRTERITRENVDELVGDAVFIFDNVDDLETKFVLSELAVRKEIPHAISSMIDINSYAAIFHTPYTPCFHCLYDRDKLLEIAEIRKYADPKDQTPNPVASPSLFLSTGFICNEALKIILGFENPAYNKYFYFNQRASNELANTDGHLIITYPFSDHFKETALAQGFDWDGDWRGNYTEELDISHNPNCPICRKQAETGADGNWAREVATATEEVTPDWSNQREQQVVALLFEHGEDMLVGLLGALKSGNIYLPLDPTYPEKRLIYMLENSEASLIVTNEKNYTLACRLMAKVNNYLKVLNISEINPQASYKNVNLGDVGEQIAYILYTSGSTGNPKGVVQNRENIWHFIKNYIRNFEISSEDRLTLFSAFGHDAAVMDIYSALLSGATLYPVNIKDELNLADLTNWICEEKITIFHSVPTVFRYFMETLHGQEKFPDLKTIILGGEGVLRHDVKKFKELFPEHVVLANLYGQSESSYNSTKFVTHGSTDQITLGETIEGVEIFLVDEEGEEVEPLEIGEILIAGKHLAFGYWNNPAKTEEVFAEDEEFGRLYWTGDLGRLQLDGQIEFVGREDFQVKVRGYRVELTEIENQLLNHHLIKEVVVLAKDDVDGNKELIGYLVTEEGIGEGEVRSYLSKYLPDYMVPAQLVFIETMPLTGTNKIDRKALLGMATESNVRREFIPPASDLEKRLVEIWSKILGIDRIGVTNSFFDLGGHSLKATQLSMNIYKELGVKIPLSQIFLHPTIREMGDLVCQMNDGTEYLKILPVDHQEYYPLSSAQKRLFVLDQLNKNSIGYNMPSAYWLEGQLNKERLATALKELIHRHEGLRTSFVLKDGEMVQKVLARVNFEIHDLQVSEEKLDETVRELIQPFDLSQAPLLRVNLIQVGEKHLLFYDIHHIIADATSKGLLISELIRSYYGEELLPLKIQYKDFANWQNQLFTSGEIEEQRNFWMDEFARDIPVLNLPSDHPRPKVMDYEGDKFSFSLDQELTEGILKVASETGTTLFMVLLAAFNLFLAKYSGQKDIVIGTPIAGRNYPELEHILGMFVNTLALRSQVAGDESYRNYLQQIKEKTLAAYENQDFQFEMLVEELELIRDMGRHPLFDVMLVLQNIDGITGRMNDLEVRPYSLATDVTRFDLTLFVFEGKENLFLRLDYRTSLYKRKTMERMAKHFVHLLSQIALNVDEKIGQMEVLSKDEIDQIIYERNRTGAPYPKKPIHQLIEEVADESPDKTAIVFQGQQLTYRELNERGNQLARYLQSVGVKSGELVGLMMNHSPEMVIGLLAILKIGGAYLPIDAHSPVKRIDDILADSQLDLLLTEQGLCDSLAFAGKIVDITEEKLYVGDWSNLEVKVGVDQLAYLIYTSGTTGRPKGVMISHKSLVNYSWWAKKVYIQDREVTFPLYSSLAFDLTVTSIFPPLISGNRIIIYPGERKELLIQQIIEDNQVDVLKLTPTHLELVKELDCSNSKLQVMVVGGEELKTGLAREIYHKFADKIEIYNEYGPTEATVGCMVYTFNKDDDGYSVPIGVGADNHKIYLLDSSLKPAPDGTVGEIYIGGDGLALGYLHKKELTEERFLSDPFNPGELMYRTGDLGRWLPDGNIEFLGRNDQQVKIRGHRIELLEIEISLLNNSLIDEATVMVKADHTGDKYLIAYLVTKDGFDSDQIRPYLAECLPDYMIPAHYVTLERMPLTMNGKIDRVALSSLDQGLTLEKSISLPETEMEKRLVEIWSQILSLETVGIDHSFFEVGGHSLKAVRMISLVNKELGVELSLREIFAYPTIRELAVLLEEKETIGYSSIEPVDVQEYYPVSSAQKRLFLLSQIESISTTYNMPGMIKVESELDVERLNDVLQKLIERHETLRTSFEIVDGVIVQKVHEKVEFEIHQLDLTLESDVVADELIQKFVQPFDLGSEPLFRVSLVKLEEDKYILMYDLHHIISDGVSMVVLIKELNDLYQGVELTPLRIQYKDFTVWQNQLFETGKMKEQEEFWLETLAEELPILNLPIDYPRPKLMTFQGDRLTFNLDEDQYEGLKKLTTDHDATLYMTLLAIYNLLLAKYTGQNDIIVGSPVAGRGHVDLNNLIGVFVNTVVMRNHLSHQLTFAEYLVDVKDNTLKAFENQDYQFDLLVEKLDLERDLSRNPVFDTMFTLQNFADQRDDHHDSELVSYNFSNQIAKFDLSLTAVEGKDQIQCSFEYSTKLFKKSTIERMAKHFKNIVTTIVENSEIQIAEIELITDEERVEILNGFYNTQVEYPTDQTLHQLFKEQVIKTPDQTALVLEDQWMTYQELDQKSTCLAKVLRDQGIDRDQIVGMLVEPSFEMVIGIFAILKAGGAYLPIDPEYPEERIKYILDDSKPMMIVTQSTFSDQIQFDGELINLDELDLSERVTVENINRSNDLAYVIYTSGSTGRPKGVMVEHKSVVNLVNWYNTNYLQNADQNVLQMTNYTFDPAVEQIFGTLCHGSTLHLIKQEVKLNKELFKRYLKEHQIHIVNMVPSAMKELLLDGDKIQPVKVVISGGEKLDDHVKDQLIHLGYNVYNHYGLTETTVEALVAKCSAEKVVLGRPVSNTKCYILDQQNHLLPVGVVGEICIAGDCLARGYLNKDELTKERFIQNPVDPAGRMYKTGDLGRWLPDGTIEFVGRLDNQVKIRGFRIELVEIEHHLTSYQSIKESVVIDLEDQAGNKNLCAYVVTDSDVSISDLRGFLAKELPNYMIPSHFVQLEKLPLTSNGKINRKALPKPDGALSTTEYVAPSNDIEEKLVTIWSNILGMKKVGVTDNFFESGGHSLKAASMISRVHKELNVELSLKEVFARPTIRELAKEIVKLEKSTFKRIEQVEERDYYPVSSAQKRLFILSQMEGISTTYNMPGAFKVSGDLDIEKLRSACKELIQRHETLRTSFEMVDGEVVQKVHPEVEFEITYHDSMVNCESVVEDELIIEFIEPFDLSRALLLRVALFKMKEDEYLLIFDLHHIIADGVSFAVLARELTELYDGKSLVPLKIQYKDYAAWQDQLFDSGQMKEQEKYWLKTLAGELPILNLPTDDPRPSIMSFKGDRVTCGLSQDQTERLQNLTADYDCTLYMALLGIYNILLAKYSNQSDIIIGSPIAGRGHVDLDHLIGMFVNTLVLRNVLDQELTFGEFLAQVKDNTLQAFDNQDYQFDRLVEQLDLKRDMSRNPIFDVVLTLQNQIERSGEPAESSGLRFEQYKFAKETAQFDLNLIVVEREEMLGFVAEYRTDLFRKETVIRITEHFINLIEQVTKDPEMKLREIELITPEEKEKLLVQFTNTEVAYPKDLLIQQLFERQVGITPEKTTLVWDGQWLSYAELNKKSNQLAHLLRSKGIKPEKIVGVVTEDSFEMIIGILGIMKAGGAYLPIDPKLPDQRIAYMLQDSRADLLLTENNSLDKVVDAKIEVINLSDQEIYTGEADNLKVANQLKDLAYVIYTSGSSGRPKGVLIEHQSLLNQIHWYKDYYKVDQTDRIVKFAGFSFDPSVVEIFPYLISGAEMHFIDNQIKLNLHKLNEYFHQNQITINFLPTQLCEQFMRYENKSLRILFTGGDKLNNFIKRDYQLVNNYGPTENTVTATVYQVNEKMNNIPIGEPIANNQIYILNQNDQLQPIGVYGELCITGVGLARGYLNRPELTEEKFVANPFKPGERMYRTGDLARWLPNGRIEFMGRIDHQVKIRGYRIELGEIEAELTNKQQVKEAVVLVREDDTGDKYLCGYVTHEEDEKINLSKLRRDLLERLPDYMVPAYFLILDEIPLTPNGKVDRKALPLPERSKKEAHHYIAPTNDMEEKLAAIWSEILGLEQISIEDNFFKLGGHSLKATSMITKVYKELNVDLSLKEVFNRPTIRELAKEIAQIEKSSFTNIQKVEEREYYPVSSAQRRLFLIEQLERVNTAYNLPQVVILTGKVDIPRLENAFNQLIQRHESLRTSFTIVDGEVMQQISSEVAFTIEFLEFEHLEIDSEEMKVNIKEFIRPFDLNSAPLLRVKLIKGKDGHLLVTDVHHIVADGVSMMILMEEFVKLYAHEFLAPLEIQYRDFATWQHQLFNSARKREYEDFWLTMFAGKLEPLNLPTDYHRPTKADFRGSLYQVEFSEDLTARINELALKNEATLYMVLLAAYNVLLAKYSNQSDIVVGSPNAGRHHADLAQVIGMFVNTLPVRNQLQKEQSFSTFLAEVKERMLQVSEYQAYPLEMLIEKLNLQWDINRNLLFDTVLVLQNMDPLQLNLDHFKMRPYPLGLNMTKFDITVTAMEKSNRLTLIFEYRLSLFKEETIRHMADNLIKILETIVEDEKIQIKDIQFELDYQRIETMDMGEIDFTF